MSELIFIVAQVPDGSFAARAVNTSIFTEAESVAELRAQVRDAVRCHFEPADLPRFIRLRFIRDETIPV